MLEANGAKVIEATERGWGPKSELRAGEIASPTTKRGLRLTTIELEVGDGQVPH